MLESTDVKGFEEGKGADRAAESPAHRQRLPRVAAPCTRTGVKDWASIWHFSENAPIPLH